MCITNNSTSPFVETCCDYGGSSTLFIVTQFPSRKYVISQIFYCFVNGVLIIPTVLLNSISVFTIWKTCHLKAKLCYFLILVQSLVDLGVGLISLPLYIVHAAVELMGTANCVDGFALQAVAYIPVGTSFLTIYLLTFERYLSILHPVIHRLYVTKTQVLLYVCCATASVIVAGPVLTIISAKVHNGLSTATVWLVLAFNTFAYMRIYFAVKNMRFSKNTIRHYSTEQSSYDMGTKRSLLRERNLAKSCGLVVLISYFCYVPFVVSSFYFKDDHMNYRVATCWSAVVMALNSSLNSLVFFWKRPLLRQEVLSVLRKVSGE